MIEAAKGYMLQGEFRLSEAESLPYLDQSFDLAFMSVLLHETDDPVKAHSKAGQGLAAGGGGRVTLPGR